MIYPLHLDTLTSWPRTRRQGKTDSHAWGIWSSLIIISKKSLLSRCAVSHTITITNITIFRSDVRVPADTSYLYVCTVCMYVGLDTGYGTCYHINKWRVQWCCFMDNGKVHTTSENLTRFSYFINFGNWKYFFLLIFANDFFSCTVQLRNPSG